MACIVKQRAEKSGTRVMSELDLSPSNAADITPQTSGDRIQVNTGNQHGGMGVTLLAPLYPPHPVMCVYISSVMSCHERCGGDLRLL